MTAGSANSAATRVIFIFIIGGVAVFTLPTVLILGIGMLPTVAAMISDRRKEKYATLCVGCMNFVGVLPFMIKLWTEDHSYDNAFKVIGDPFTWLVMFGAAALGWAIYFVAPGIVGMFIGMRTEQRVQRLRRRQRDLVEEWGPGVAGGRRDAEEKADKPR
ncbi:hypothetical protein BAL199_04709 [alpha proteobacterium BAL199]|jgi:hypothetical protein|nr:hypothetical protein BAL199_04709 [alpha proteobacterium BAL199]